MRLEEANNQRSQLINAYKTAVRNIEKELKKKRLPVKRREELEAELEQLERSHKEELELFDEEHGIESKKKGAVDEPAAAAAEKEHEENEHDSEHTDLRVRNWGSLSKKELEESCAARGLSKKGTKEQLISRLQVWSSGKYNDAKEPGNIDYETFQPVQIQLSGPSKKDEYREKRKKLWKRREQAPLREGPRPGDEDESDSEEEADEGSELQAKVRKNDRPDDSSESEEEDEEEKKARDLAERQAKRRAVVNTVLGRVLSKYSEGVPIDELPDKLKEFKVVNFSPELLGYKSLEEWIGDQPAALLRYKRSTRVVKPVAGVIPSSDDDSDSDLSDKDDNSDEDSDRMY